MTWLQEVDVADDMAGLIIFSAGFFFFFPFFLSCFPSFGDPLPPLSAMAHSVLMLGASGARGRGGGVGCRCWVGLLIRCRCWAGAAAEGEGAVDGWSRLVLLLGCG